jgi:hypothetical protein
MSGIGDQQPCDDHDNTKAPRRHWEATESFCDLKLSHWVEIFLTFALLLVGISQLVVYWRQAGIMKQQAVISRQQNDITIAIQRAFVSIYDVDIVVRKDEEGKVLAWDFSVVVENTGSTPTVEASYLTSGSQGLNRGREGLSATDYPLSLVPSVPDPGLRHYTVKNTMNPRFSRLPLGPKAKRKIFGISIEATTFKELAEGSYTAYFPGQFTTKTAFRTAPSTLVNTASQLVDRWCKVKAVLLPPMLFARIGIAQTTSVMQTTAIIGP